jgi:hypothetical protein
MRIKFQISIAFIFVFEIVMTLLAGQVPAFQSQMKGRQPGEYGVMEFAQSKPAVGESAPEMELKTLDGETVSLASYRGKNIVVIKAGYTSPPILLAAAGLRQLHQQYLASSVVTGANEVNESGAAKTTEPTAEIIIVCQKESHAGELAFKDIEQPESFEQRCELARRMKDEYELPMTVLVDTMENQSQVLFGDFPSPAFVIDTDGVIRDKFPWADAAMVKTAVAKLGNFKRKQKRLTPAIWIGVLVPLFIVFIVVFSKSKKQTANEGEVADGNLEE